MVNKITASSQDKKIIPEHTKDLLDMAGSLAYRRKKGRSFSAIRKLEKKAVSEAIIENHRKK